MLPVLFMFRIKKIGKHNLKKLKKEKQNFILVCNHMSNWDAVLLDVIFNKKHRYLGKKELFDTKFKSWFMKGIGCIPVDRQKPEPSSIKEIFSVIKKGEIVAIFPQGTRSKTVKIEDGSAKEGAALFSVRTNTPVLPMMFSGKAKPFKKVKLYIGEPIYPDLSRTKDKTYVSEFSDIIISKMNSLLEGDNQNENEGL